MVSAACVRVESIGHHEGFTLGNDHHMVSYILINHQLIDKVYYENKVYYEVV